MKLAIARIGRPHGVKGEVTIELLTDLPEERFSVGKVIESDSGIHPTLEISRVRIHQGIWMLTFNEIKDRTMAERVRNSRLYSEIDIDEEVGDEDSIFHIEELRGLRVIDHDGAVIGSVTGVQNLPGQDLLEIETPRGQRLIPMVHQFIREIDIEAGRITVEIPAGLMD